MGCGCGPGATCDNLDDEMPSAADLARFGDEHGTTCQECGTEIYEDAVLCPQCGTFQAEGLRDGPTVKADGPAGQGLSKVVFPVAVVLLIIAFVFLL